MKAQKKMASLVLAACLSLLCAACSGQTAPAETPAPTAQPVAAPIAATPAPTQQPAPEPTAAPTVGDEPVTGATDGSVLFERDGLKVTTAGLDYDDTPIIWVDVENRGDKDLFLGVTDGAANGFATDVYLIRFYEDEDGGSGSNYSFDQAVPAGETSRFALGYSGSSLPGVDLSTLSELAFRFTLAGNEFSWPDYSSAPVTIQTGEQAATIDIADLGAVVIDNDKLRLVLGEQDYDDFFGPTIDVYLENKTDRYIGLTADTAEADGVFCDYIYGSIYAGPHKKAATFMCFDGEVGEMKGFKELTVAYSLYEGETYDPLNDVSGTELDPVTVTYPPQIWGEYENGGFTMEITPKYNEFVTVEIPENNEYGGLFDVYETASMEAGGYEGAGWLFSIGKIGADRLHEMLCWDMSGAEVFAKDDGGSYYVYYHPTDVRYERATVEEMQRDAQQWSMVCEWAYGMRDAFRTANGLESESYGNTDLDMYVARAAWDKDTKASIAFLEPYGAVELTGVDGTAYADFLLHGRFWEDWDGELEAPDGEYMVLNLPEENVRIDFFFGDPGIVRVTRDGEERLYQAMWCDDNISYAEAVHGWYYAAAEKAGLKQPDAALDAFLGGWAEQIAGRCTVSIEKSLAPGKVRIDIRWPESAAVCHFWTLTAGSEEGALFYQNGEWEVVEYDADGESWTTECGWDEAGSFELAGGKLCWHDDVRPENGEVVFVRAY